MKQKDILNRIQEQLQDYVKNDFKEGNIAYDLSAPFSYAIEEITNVMDKYETQFNLNTLDEEILNIWAPLRIGERYSGNPPNFIIESEDGSEIQDIGEWYLERNHNIRFQNDEMISNVRIRIIGNRIGRIQENVWIGAIMISLDDDTKRAKIVEVISLGNDIESYEQYLDRYKRSFVLDVDAGTGEYYRRRISEYSGVGIAGVDYDQSSARETTVVYITDSTYRVAPSAEFCREVLSYYTSEDHNIVPIGQTLEIYPIIMRTCVVVIEYINVVKEFNEDDILSYLWSLNETKYSIELFQTKNLMFSISVEELRNLLIIRFQEYCTITSVAVNGVEDYIHLNHQLPSWVVRL